MTTKIKTPGITDANVTTDKLNLISTSGTPGATIKGTSGQTDGYLQLNCEENTHGIKLKSPPHSAAQSYTLTFPQSITNGYFLKTDGSGNLSFAEVNVDDTAWQSSIVTAATLSAVVGYGYWIDTTSNACTITLPASANVGDQIIFVDYARTWATNAVTLSLNGLKYQGGINNPIYDTNGQTVNIVYSGATKGWIPISDDDVFDEGTLPTYSADFLVVAGGGGGGYGFTGGYYGGGAGGGGYRNSFNSETSGRNSSSESALTFTQGVTYTVTVGAGGAIASNGVNGTIGGNSLISGTGITTVTSIGGGFGQGGNDGGGTGGDGGCGGGGADGNQGTSATGGSGTAGQGFDGGAVPGDNNAAAGGGGAGAIGAFNAGGDSAGGAGLASSITGSAVTRSVGGVGADSSPDTSGANTGKGGDGSKDNNTAPKVGGSGVVIIRVPTASYSSTTSGSPSVSTSGSDTIMIFNASGSYTG